MSDTWEHEWKVDLWNEFQIVRRQQEAVQRMFKTQKNALNLEGCG